MKQEIVAQKILADMEALGLSNEKVEDIIWEFLKMAYAAGHDAGRKIRTFHRPVIQLSLNGKPIKIYESVQDAVRSTGLNKSNIANCARGRKGCLTCGGYKWKYVNQSDGKSNDGSKGNRAGH